MHNTQSSSLVPPACPVGSFSVKGVSNSSVMPLLGGHLGHSVVSLLEIHVPPAPVPAVRPCNAAPITTQDVSILCM